MEIQELRELDPGERAEVRSRYADVYFPEPVLEPVWYGRREHTRIDGRKAIIDQKSENVFGICSDQYKIVPFEDVVSLVEKTVTQITSFGEIKVKPTTYADGARLRVSIGFPDKKISIVKGDNIVPKIEIFSSLDLSTLLKGLFGAFQLKCSNGMGVWKTFQKYSKKHLQNLHIGELAHSINEGLSLFGTQAQLWKEWGNTKITQGMYDELWTSLPFSPAEKEKIEALPEIGTRLLIPVALKSNDLDLWSLNSVLTQFATHEVASELRRIDLEPKIARAMEMTYDKLH